MLRRLLLVAFVLAAFVPQAIAAQSSTPKSSTSKSSTSKSSTSKSTANSSGKNGKHYAQHRQSPWSNVIVNGVSVPSSSPAPKSPGKNKVHNDTGGTVFKSIGN